MRSARDGGLLHISRWIQEEKSPREMSPSSVFPGLSRREAPREPSVKKKNTRCNSCRELNEKGRSGDGASKKRPYLHTQQLQFQCPVMDLRPTVNSLDDPEESDLGGGDTPAVFSFATSPAPTPAEDQANPARETGVISEGSPEASQQPKPRRRRVVRQSSSGQDTRESIDSRVIEFLAQRRTEGEEETLLMGLAPLLRQVPRERHNRCIASIIMVLEMFASNYQGDILSHINNLRCQILMIPPQQYGTSYLQHPHQPQGPPSPPPTPP
ncbi:uncharacterized protein LOC122933882 [Bufo gargarizans]|uniref:uncharacterized protein LOC122933882 n=1 Tax=Bufo gargarizans TaxID=30331 RepID=UPI001CF29B19|nr:uncharacterized protein LOC122933882 [Bufo gargarizans]